MFRGWGLLLRGIRVYELARELGISSKDILRLLADKMHIEMNNHMATLNDQVVARLRLLVAEERGPAASAKPAPASAGSRPAAAGARSQPAVAATTTTERATAAETPVPQAAPAVPPSAGHASSPSGAAQSPPHRTPAMVRPGAPRPNPMVRAPGAPTPMAGPVHFRPAPGLLPLVAPRPTPPRPRRPLPRPEPSSPAVAAASVAPAEAETRLAPSPPEVAAVTVEPSAPVPVGGRSDATEAPTEPRLDPVEVASQAEPEAESETTPEAEALTTTSTIHPEPQPADVAREEPSVAAARRAPVPRPAPRHVVVLGDGDAREADAGQPARTLLPVRRVTPGQPPPLRFPDRPLLPIRKVDPNAPRPAVAAAAAGVAPAAAPGAHPAAGGLRRGHRTAFDRGPTEGGVTTDPRRRGGAGRRPARPGAVTASEGDDVGRRLRRRRGRRIAAAAAAAEAQTPEMPESITLAGPLQVSALAALIAAPAPEIIRKLLDRGVMAAIHQQIDVAQARSIAEDYGIVVEVEGNLDDAHGTSVDRRAMGVLLGADDPDRSEPRSPIVTVLGHVDHGKTTLLDAIRQSRVAAGEAGGITQHIGAYTVAHGDRRVVFLDTPGHEAFTAMRARGAQVTDIAVLVVAADDGVMPQTKEALSHARAAEVPIVVALNKVDKPDANPERVMQQLAEVGLVPESWGGDTPVVPVSALKGQGISELLEMLLLVADLQELRADSQRNAVGTVIEAEVSKGRGPVATVLVQGGTLRVGDTFVAGQVFGRVRAMLSDVGRPLRSAGPSTPVEVLGFDEVPAAGDVFQVLPEREARETAQNRQSHTRHESLLAAERAMSLEEFHQASQAGAAEDLSVILKADVQGSLEAVRTALEKVQNEEVRVVVLHVGVGPVNESDIMLAAASKAVILGFNVRPDATAEREAQRLGVEIKTYRVIYELLDEVQRALDGRLKPKYETVTVGHAEVRKPIRVPDIGVIAGSFVTDGIVRRAARMRVLRGGTIIHEGTVASLRRFKDDVREVAAGFECGIGLERFGDVKEGDVIEVLEEREVPR